MDMPEGWRSKYALNKFRWDNSNEKDITSKEYIIAFELMKELANSLEDSIQILELYISDTINIIKKEDHAKSIEKERIRMVKILNRFKKWK